MNENNNSFKEKLTKKRYLNLVVFLVAFSAIAGSVIYFTSAAPKPKAGSSGNFTTPTVYLSPTSGKVSSNNTLRLEIWEDSQSQPVNAVQTNLAFDANKFDVVSIDGSASAFDIQAQSASSAGSINIGRGHVGFLIGRQLVSVVTLKPKSSGKTNINFSNGTVLVNATSNNDILSGKVGASFNIGR